jgi:hypothetical protein
MGHRVNTVDAIAVISSTNCGVDVLCLRAVEPDLRYYTQDACIVSLNRLITRLTTTLHISWTGGAYLRTPRSLRGCSPLPLLSIHFL